MQVRILHSQERIDDDMNHKKEAILNYKIQHPDAFDIECRIELGMEADEYIQLRDELVKDGILHKTVRRTYMACRDEDGTIRKRWINIERTR
jgi:hypothetical protein